MDYGAIEEPSIQGGRTQHGSRLRSVCSGLVIVAVAAAAVVIMVSGHALPVVKQRAPKDGEETDDVHTLSLRHRDAQHFGGVVSSRRRNAMMQLEKVGDCFHPFVLRRLRCCACYGVARVQMLDGV